MSFAYLRVAWLYIIEEKYYSNEKKSAEEIKPTPPSTGYFDIFIKHIREWLSELHWNVKMYKCVHV